MATDHQIWVRFLYCVPKSQSPDEYRLIQTWPVMTKTGIAERAASEVLGNQQKPDAVCCQHRVMPVGKKHEAWIRGQRCHGVINIISITTNKGACSNHKGNLYVIGSIPIKPAKKFGLQLSRQSKRQLGTLIHNLFPSFLSLRRDNLAITAIYCPSLV